MTRLRPTRVLPALLLAALMVAAGVVLGTPRVANAHAALVSSEPAANAALEASPGRVSILFTERLVPAVSVIEVLDSAGNRVDLGDTRRDEREPRAMAVSLPSELADGVYTVAWRNLSDVDGHPQRGSFVFFIGEADFSAQAAEAETPLFASPLEPPLRWAVLAGAMLLAGVPAVFAFTLAPAVPTSGRVGPRGALRRRMDAVPVVGGVVMLAAGYAQLGVQWDNTGLPVAPGHPGGSMRWSEFEEAEPEFAGRVRAVFDAHIHKTMATLRADGSPRVSGTEAPFTDGDLRLGMMERSAKARDLLHDSRLAIHSATVDAELADGDAKVSGRAVPAGPASDGPDGAVYFNVDVQRPYSRG